MPVADPVPDLVAAVRAADPERTRQVLREHPELLPRLNDPLPGFHFDGTALLAAVETGNTALIDVLLDAGADIHQESHWWAGGFGVLDGDHDLHGFLVSRGAIVDIHAAARLGDIDRMRALLAADPALVHARGGDGCTPLHFVRSLEAAAFLLDHGADIDARDVDHESTPAQHLVRERPEVAHYLVQRGCRTDILLVAALGDLARVKAHLDEDPDSIHTAVDAAWFPMQDPRAGGHIYRWTLGEHRTAHLIAHEQGHTAVFDLLMSRSPAPMKLQVACASGDEAAVHALLQAQPDLATLLDETLKRALPAAARDNDLAAVRLMLKAGWPLEPRGADDGTALHWAAWHGNDAMVQALLARGAPVDIRERSHGGTPLVWAMHGSRNSWHRGTGDHAAVAEALLAAGATLPTAPMEATDEVLAVLARHR